MIHTTFTVNNQSLDGNIFYPPSMQTKSPAILFIHGWTSVQDRYYEQAEELATAGFVCLTFDMRGHGKSVGDIEALTRQNFIDDVLAAYDFLARNKSVDPENITVIGSSFGSYLAALLSKRRNVKNLILRAPANYPDGSPDETIFKYAKTAETLAWRQQPREINEVESLKSLKEFSGKILIVESGNDELVPHQTIQNYINAVEDKSTLTYFMMQGAPHSLSGSPQFKKEFEEIVKGWLRGKV